MLLFLLAGLLNECVVQFSFFFWSGEYRRLMNFCIFIVFNVWFYCKVVLRNWELLFYLKNR